MRIMLPPDRRRRPFEAEGQCGAGACGTVDCCCEREGQTHLSEVPAGGSIRPCYHGATRTDLTTELLIRPGHMVGRFRVLDVALDAQRFTGQPPRFAGLGAIRVNTRGRATAGLSG
jgi:hypothetical protein